MKNEGSEARGREIKSQRERELDELRSRGVAKSRREKLKDFSAPLQTAEEAQDFLIACREQHGRRESFGTCDIQPSNMSAIDYNSFLMEQTRRQRELKMRRREAEQLLHGFRGFYKESFGSWLSPRTKDSRTSLSFGYGDVLGDPDDTSRRSSAVSRLYSWDEDEGRDDSERPRPNPLDPHRKDFLKDNRHYDGTQYPRTDQDMEVSNGVVLFSPDGSTLNHDWDNSKDPRLSLGSLASTARQDWGDQESRDDSHQQKERLVCNPLDPQSRDFLNNNRHYDGTQYPRTDQNMEVSTGVNMFSHDESNRKEGERNPTEFREFPTSTRNADGQDRAEFPVENFDRDAVLFGESGVGEYLTERDRVTSASPLKFGEDRSSEDTSAEHGFASPFKSRLLNLQVNTDREDSIDVGASAQRLRHARTLDGREIVNETDPRRDESSSAGKMREQNPAASPAPPPTPSKNLEEKVSKIEISQSVSRDESIYHQQQASPRPETIWRNFISDEPGAKFPPEAGRYHLYASYACPGSHRALIVRALKGLEDVISVTIVHPTWRHTNPNNPNDRHRGWIFGDPNGKPFHNTMGRGGPFPSAYPDNSPDPVLNAYSVRNLYEHAEDTSGKYTIPLLWDTKNDTIVNNESSDITYMLNSCFNAFADNPVLDLYTEDDADGLDRLNEVSKWLYPMMIHGVYRCGFAKTQRAYDQAIEELTEAFDAADELLQHQRYLTGDTLTDADIRFFVTLLRFDEVYAFYFRANTRLVLMTSSLLNFCREIYQMPGVAETCQMDQIKAHFFGSHAEWNKYSVVPRGLGFMRYLEMPHDREKLTGFGHI
mmetsp:Transcript_1130/g.2602  ORF Transcript_1130/g.2602 Transcript_1130/m.2602 type:complete len:825 (+) Transcript_1130:250-2724(+)